MADFNRPEILLNGVSVGIGRKLNFIEGSNVTITLVSDGGEQGTDVQIDVAGGAGGDHGGLTGLTDDDHTQYILHAIADAEGDLLLASGANTFTRLGIGNSGELLTSNGTTASWQPAGAASHPAFVSHTKYGVD